MYTNGEKLDGEWNGSAYPDYGIYTYANGDRYGGSWKQGKKHGIGTYYFSSGAKYQGEYKDGEPHGTAVFIEADGRAFNEEWSGGRRKARTAITTVKYEAGPSADAKAAEDAARSPPNHAAVGMGPTTPPVAASTKVPASAHASTPPISPLVDVDGVACAPAAAAASKGAYAPDADFDAFFTAPAGMAPAAAPATDSSLLDLLGSPDAAPPTAAATVVSGPDLLL